MTSIKLTSAAIIAAIALCSCGGVSESDASIRKLDRALNQRDELTEARQARIDSLKTEAAGDLRPYATLMTIGNAYISFVNDSAVHYFYLAEQSASDNEEATAAKLRRAALMPLGGFYEAAEKTFNAIDSTMLSEANLRCYHESGRQLYSYLSSAFEDFPPYRQRYQEKSLAHQKQLLGLLDRSSDEYQFNLGEYYFLRGQNERAEALLSELVKHSSDKNLLARACHHLASIALAEGDRDSYRRHLAESALHDAQSATLEVRSLQELGAAMFTDGDINRSYSYLTAAMDNAVRCGATLRMIESSRIVPIINKAHSFQAESWQKRSYVIMTVMALLMIGLAASLYLLYRQMKRLNYARLRLRLANSSKDLYISRFLQLCSIYMDKLNRFCKIAERKISAGKTDELYRMVKSGKFIEEQSADFYKVFDDAFLHLYPDFVSRVNDLLKPECRIILEKGERLNTDLRILAISRMGIDDAASIAQILNYSLNTIYAYRNRLKARAIDRENFEANVMKISPAT